MENEIEQKQEKLDNEKIANINKLKAKKGTLEPEKLKPGKVKGLGVRLEEVKKDGKVIGEKVVVICKHPDKEENVEISSVKFEKKKGNKSELVTSGLWYKLDKEGKVIKYSAVWELMEYYQLDDLESATGKDFNAVTDDSGYLCIKAY